MFLFEIHIEQTHKFGYINAYYSAETLNYYTLFQGFSVCITFNLIMLSCNACITQQHIKVVKLVYKSGKDIKEVLLEENQPIFET